MNPVRNQGQCGSCWAFATVATLEGQYAILNKKKVELSEQQFVDCDLDNLACKGGMMSRAFLYAQRVGGVMSRSNYPYVGV